MSGSVALTGLRRFGLAVAAVLALAAAMTPQPAAARVWVEVGPAPGYYYAPAYYPHPWHRPYWRAHWRHRHWCYWHPYRCHYGW